MIHLLLQHPSKFTPSRLPNLHSSDLAVLALICYNLLLFKRWGDENPHVLRFVVCFALMIAELLTENMLVSGIGCQYSIIRLM